MLKSGLIVGVVMIVLAIGSTLISPLCAPCVALLAGLGAGYLACVFDRPPGRTPRPSLARRLEPSAAWAH